MPPRNRVIVPDLSGDPSPMEVPDEATVTVPDDEAPTPEDERENSVRDAIGDISDMGDRRFREWKWYVYRLRTPVEKSADPRAGDMELMTVFGGPVDVLQIQREFGGGLFEFRGFMGRMKIRQRATLGGPRKNWIQEAEEPRKPTSQQIVSLPNELTTLLKRL